MNKRTVRNKLAVLMAMVMLFVAIIPMSAFAAETDTMVRTTSENAEESTINITFVNPSGIIVGSAQVSSAYYYGTASISLNGTAKTFWFLGNQNGGGANDTIALSSDQLDIQGKKVKVDGQYYQIATKTINGGTVNIDWILSTAGTYNLVFLAFDR